MTTSFWLKCIQKNYQKVKEDIEGGLAMGIDGYLVMANNTPAEVVQKIISITEQKKISNA